MENSKLDKINNMDKMDFECKDNGEVYKKVIFEPIRIGPISTLDEMDSKVLQFQNKKLEMKLEEYQRIESELQQRIQQLEKRQNQDETVLNIVNTYWNQLNDDIGAVLLDVDDEYDTDQIESETALNFINELTSWDETQIDEKLMNSVQISTSSMAKIIRAYDHTLSKNYKTLSSLKLRASEDALIENTNDIDYADSKIKYKLNIDNQDKRLQKVRNHDSTTDKDRKRIKLDQNNDSSDEKSVERTDSDIVTENKKETTSFTKVFSNIHSNSSNKVTCDSFRNHESYKERALNRSDNSNNHDSGFTCNGKCTNDIEDKNPNRDIPPDYINCEVRAVVSEIIDKIEAQSDTFSEPVKQLFFGDDDKIRAYVNQRKETQDRDDHKLRDRDVICDKELKNIFVEVTHDNVRLQNIISAFQNQQQKIIANEQKIDDDLNIKLKEYEEWRSQIEDVEYENEKLKCKKFKIEHHLSEAAETLEKLKVRKRNRTKSDSSVPAAKKYEEFEEELELQTEIANNRAEELETLRAKYQNNLDTIEELEKKLNELPDDVIEETTEYKCLQSQFSVLYNDTILIKDQIEEYHAHIQTLNATFANKMEMTEVILQRM